MIGFLAPVARAQQVAVAEIDGYVTDPSGQAIVGAQVKATNLDREQVRSATTDVTGRYALPNLPVGNYQLEVASPGFKTYVQKGISLEVASNRSIPVSLQIGAVTESVQVTANAAQVETKENSIAQVVDQQRLIDLPLNGRNPADLLRGTGCCTSDVLPKKIENWPLTSLQQWLLKTGGRLVQHARHCWLMLAESHLTGRLFGAMVGRIAALPVPTG